MAFPWQQYLCGGKLEPFPGCRAALSRPDDTFPSLARLNRVQQHQHGKNRGLDLAWHVSQHFSGTNEGNHDNSRPGQAAILSTFKPNTPCYSLSQLNLFLAGGNSSANGAVLYEHFECALPVTISAVLHLSSIGPGNARPWL
jgi:hypothetical protein